MLGVMLVVGTVKKIVHITCCTHHIVRVEPNLATA